LKEAVADGDESQSVIAYRHDDPWDQPTGRVAARNGRM